MVTIIICTRNRASILKHCLDSFVDQKDKQLYSFELLVVDNGSVDSTRDLVQSYGDKFEKLHYVFEPKVGLSQARNRGFKEANYEWVAYVDDDAKAFPDFISRVFFVIHNFKFDCFGGRFFPWYIDSKPKWLSDEFGLFPLLLPTIGELRANAHVAGGVMVLRKSLLNQVGGFPLSLGMSGDKIGYGEENWVQDELRKLNCVIGFDPELRIEHLVAPYKFNLRWHLRRMYAKGLTDRIMDSVQPKISPFLLFNRSLVSCLIKLLFNLPRLLFSRNYYYQNYFLESVGYFIKTCGYISK